MTASIHDPHTQQLIEAYRSGNWTPDEDGDLMFRVSVDERGHVLSISPGAEGAGHPFPCGVAAMDSPAMLAGCVGFAIYYAREEVGLTHQEIRDLNTRERLNVWANEIFEQAADIDTMTDPEIESAVQCLSEAADRLSRLTHSDDT